MSKAFYEVAENPLLLTFMLMTFERFGEVPTQMHTFYGEVYDLLSKRHDASKAGFDRNMEPTLTLTDLNNYYPFSVQNRLWTMFTIIVIIRW